MSEKITLVCTTLNRNEELLNKMLNSAKGFDQILVHVDSDGITSYNNGKSKGVWYYPNHLSIPDAYNLVVSSVETEWVCCFPDDDYFYPEGLAKMIAEVHKGIDADVAHYKFHVSGYAPKEDKRCWFGIKEYDLCEKKPITPKLLEKHGRMPAGSFFRKSAWEKVGGFSGDFEHDRNLWLRMAQAGCAFKYFDHKVYNFVRRDNSAWIRQRAGLHKES